MSYLQPIPKKSSKYLYLIIIAIGFCMSVKAQRPILFDHIGIEEGLSQNSVISITQDKNGFMWFGTRYGLNRYDGFNIKTYQFPAGDSTLSANNYIKSLYSDSKGKLWVGTPNGLNLYDPLTDSFSKLKHDRKNPNSLSNSFPVCIYEDKNTNIWIGTPNGLNKLEKGNPNSIKRYLTNEGLKNPHHDIRTLYEDHSGHLWVGTSNGLLKMELKEGKYHTTIFTHNNQKGSISDDYISGIVEDRKKRLWISTQNGGINLFDPIHQKFTAFKHVETDPKSLINNTIRCLTIDDAGKIWIGTLDGLSTMDVETFTYTNIKYDPNENRGLNQNSIHAMYKDQSGSIWVGTYFGGVNVNYPYATTFKVYNRSNSNLNNNVISSFAQDQSGNLWVSTEGGGLNYLNQGNTTFRSFKNIPENQNSLSSNLVKKILLDKTQKLWAATHGGGLNVLDIDKKAFKHYNFGSKTIEQVDEIRAIIEDTDSRLWVATHLNGISVSNPEKTKFNFLKRLSQQLEGRNVISLIQAKNQQIYFGTSNGLYIYNPKRAEFYTLKNQRTNQPITLYINCIAETKQNNIYFGTNYNGLYYYDQHKNKLLNYTIKNGLPNNNIMAILEDDNGYLWISTANGLSMFNPVSKTFKNYTIADGLAGNEFNLNAAFKNQNGEMFFGGYKGFISFYPDQIQTNSRPSQIVATDLQRFDQSVQINQKDGLLKKNIYFTNEIVFDNSENTFSLSFALLNFIKPNKNHYLYKLEGFEKNWNHVSIPKATYTNLPEGNYTFLAKGINNDGVQSDNTLKIKIVINPPFYRTWWAYLFYTCVISAIVVLIIRYLLIRAVLKKEKEINAHKLAFFTNISHEIRTPLTLIVGPLEKLIEDTQDEQQTNKALQSMKNNADRLMKLVTELLDFRKVQSGKMKLQVNNVNIVKFCKEIFLAFQQMATIKNIHYTFNSDKEEIFLYFDLIQLEKVMFNLISNALKFSKEGANVLINVQEESNCVKINVSNEGEGIAPDSQANLFNDFYQAKPSVNIGTGLGLSFSKRIVELHSGTIGFESNPMLNGKPYLTTFTVGLKKGKEHFKSEDFVIEAPIYYKETSTDLDLESTKADLAEATEGNKRYTVLLVEDNDEIRSFIKRSLLKTYQIIESKDGQNGWETAINQIPDLIISDIMMPVMDGLELCRKLKSDERTSHIPVILLTARSSYIHQINGLETGADAYVIKPFNIKMLQLNVHNLLVARENIRNRFAQVVRLEPKKLFINTSEQNFLAKIMQIIEDEMENVDFDVPTLSSKIGMSQPVLYKKIRALTNLSVNEFIKSMRLKRAAQLLESGNESIAEIAFKVGFSDRKYFSMEFKKQFGKTPSEFR